MNKFVGCENIYRNNCLNLYRNIFIQICCVYIEGKYMENPVIAIQSSVITTIVYALLSLYFLKWIMFMEKEKTLLLMIR